MKNFGMIDLALNIVLRPMFFVWLFLSHRSISVAFFITYISHGSKPVAIFLARWTYERI